ncbi:MAG: sulfite reductase subunit alpha [Methylococcales bacterium]|nr:sulfite reductase subunit alpha [Methylococcales bacterium]
MKTLNIPSNAPYSTTQQAWLNGFFAGMHRRILQNSGAEPSSDIRVLNILYGTQTGTSESVAEDAATLAKAQGLKPIIQSMDEVDANELVAMEYLLIITSTYGEGEMPDNAQILWDAVKEDNAQNLDNTHYSVLALGDTGYDLFCQAGIDWDNRLEKLGAKRLYNRVDCDVDYEDPAEAWIAAVIPLMAEGAATVVDVETPIKEKAKFNRKNPFPATMTLNKILTSEASSKETRHYEISIADSGLSYEAGDALCVIPTNCPELVDAVINAIGCDEEEIVDDVTLREHLTSDLEIKLPNKELLQVISEKAKDPTLRELLDSGDKDKLSDYLWGRDTLDCLLQNPDVMFSAPEFIALLKPLQHRAYSISSSGKMHPNSVHLTIASVRYEAQNRAHKGVCSTYLADIVNESTEVKIFFTPNKSFRVPEDNSLPIIMVGPGTGIAPFRAFLQERNFRKATGKNWLFFGDRNAKTDFIYEDELNTMQENGILNRLDLAFSRDQEEKIYVQDKMRENGAELFAWLEQGGYFFVCGDAYRMAKDVDKALHELIAEQGHKSTDEAIDYVNQLKKEKRYVRDVY